MSGWFYLILAGFLEIGFASTLKLTQGFTKVVPTSVFIFFAIFSFYFLNKAAQTIPVGTAYAVWTGIGAFGTIIVGIIFYNEPSSFLRLLFLMTLIVSIVGLKVVS
jgi:quaternary ammonium compound-resistance protein SugE